MAVSFADRLNTLFRVVLTPADEHGNRREYTEQEVSLALMQVTGVPKDYAPYIRQLRAGKKADPGRDKMHDLARAFALLAKNMGTPGAADIDWTGDFNTYLAVPEGAPDELIHRVDQLHEQFNQIVAERERKVMALNRQLRELDPNDLADVERLVARAVERARETQRDKKRFGRRSPR